MEKQKPQEQFNYFFKRKDDGYIFAIDREISAYEIFKRKDFKDRFEYIGRNPLVSFANRIKEIKKISRRDYIDKVRESVENAGLTDAGIDDVEKIKLQDIIALEVEDAKKDKTLPRNFDIVDINGTIVLDNSMVNLLRQIR